MARFESHFLRLHDALQRCSAAVLTTLAAALISASYGLSSLQLDLSFRPLFASGADIAAPTGEFEAVFGQSSGAWIAAVLENEGVAPTEFLRESARLSKLAREIPGITDLMSLTDTGIPQWDNGRLWLAEPIPEYLLDPAESAALEAEFESLLDGTRFVNWLVSADGSRLLIAARVAQPMGELDARRRVVDEFRSLIEAEAPGGIVVYFSGVSVVELAYERQVLRDQLIATVITSAMLMLLLFWTFGNIRAVLVCLMPVTLAIPATLGIMGWLGQPVTIINTVIPVIVLVIGSADAVHMLTAWLDARGSGRRRQAATREMLRVTGKACFLTTITTIGGFLALLSAELESVGNFGLVCAIGIACAWVANQALLPWILRRIEVGHGLPDSRVNRFADRTIATVTQLALSRPGSVTAASLIAMLGCILLMPSLDIDQRFNEELPPTHPIARGQQILEQDFGGFLGPEISIRKIDGGSMIDDETLMTLGRYANALRELPDTHHVWSVRDLLPRNVREDERPTALDAMRDAPAVAGHAAELVSEDNTRLAVIARIGDVGTQRAGAYRDDVLRLAEEHWDPRYEVEVVGQWWLAQHGMRSLLDDMLRSLATAALIILPLLWLSIRKPRLVVAAIVANLLPLALPLAFMAVAGITLRIGTVVVLAIALGIVVDNTLHLVTRMRDTGGIEPAMHGAGRAVIFTTLALTGGFLSMLGNQLLAIRDMGLVAAVTILGALLADLLLLPALCGSDPAKPLISREIRGAFRLFSRLDRTIWVPKTRFRRGG